MIFLILLICLIVLVKNGPLGFLMVGFVWLLAGTFNPNIDSGLVWLIGFALGWMMETD